MTENPLEIVFVCTYCGRTGLEGHAGCGKGGGPRPYVPLSRIPHDVIERLRAEHLEAAGGVKIDPDAAEETAKLTRLNPAPPPPEVPVEPEPDESTSADQLPEEFLKQQEGWGDV